MKLNYGSKTTIQEIDHRFGEYDSKGREKGKHIIISVADVIESNRTYVPEFSDLGMIIGDAVFIVNVQASRDGKRFGAWQPHKYFKTLNQAVIFAKSKIN